MDAPDPMTPPVSATPGHEAQTADVAGPVFVLSRGTMLWMFLLNWLPLMHLALVGIAVWVVSQWTLFGAIVAGFVVLYLPPPLAVRVALAIRPIAEGKHELDSGAFRVWWFTAQCQVLFNRLPMLEEVLRIVPSVYSLWLRLWGARIGRLVFWSPGTVVLDRSFVRIGDNCVIGLGVRLHPHLITRDKDQNTPAQLWLAPVNIGGKSMIGGFSLLAPGVVVAPGSMTPAVHALPAFSEWRSGRRTRGGRPTIV